MEQLAAISALALLVLDTTLLREVGLLPHGVELYGGTGRCQSPSLRAHVASETSLLCWPWFVSYRIQKITVMS